jgi:hypothetical protein
MFGSQEIMPAEKLTLQGAACPSGVPTVFLGPVRVDPYFNKTFQVYNQSFAPITVNLQGNLFPVGVGIDAGVGVTGALTVGGQPPAYWQSIKSFTVQASGSASLVTDQTPLAWLQLTTTATIPNTTVSGFMIALSNA